MIKEFQDFSSWKAEAARRGLTTNEEAEDTGDAESGPCLHYSALAVNEKGEWMGACGGSSWGGFSGWLADTLLEACSMFGPPDLEP